MFEFIQGCTKFIQDSVAICDDVIIEMKCW